MKQQMMRMGSKTNSIMSYCSKEPLKNEIFGDEFVNTPFRESIKTLESADKRRTFI
jgi:hypothetical protein